MSSKHWFPLESNPAVMNEYIQKLGVNIDEYSFHDVYSTEDWAIDMITKPVIAVLMLFPVKEASEEYARIEKDNIDSLGQILSLNTFYMKQTIGNACGTIGLLHAIGNARNSLSIQEGSYLDHFFRNTQGMSPDDIAIYLENDTSIETIHSTAASEGQSEQQEGEVDTHFVCFSVVDGHLYELDGRKSYPINHGSSTSDMLLQSACKVIQSFMERDPTELKFTIVALSRTIDTDDN